MGQAAGLPTPCSYQQHLLAEEAVPSPELGGCPADPGLLWMALWFSSCPPLCITGQRIKGFAPNIRATPNGGCGTLVTAGLAKRRKRTMGSADI